MGVILLHREVVQPTGSLLSEQLEAHRRLCIYAQRRALVPTPTGTTGDHLAAECRGVGALIDVAERLEGRILAALKTRPGVVGRHTSWSPSYAHAIGMRALAGGDLAAARSELGRNVPSIATVRLRLYDAARRLERGARDLQDALGSCARDDA